jgi:hypothetical protein
MGACNSDTGRQTPDIRPFQKKFKAPCFVEILFSYDYREITIQVLFGLLGVQDSFLHCLMFEVYGLLSESQMGILNGQKVKEGGVTNL